ncbi:tetratricopeptide repeat protein [Polynucleobacter asymbioticus]|jgi:tetratricopeptide (TPR) repeat protein|nr:tetratricopeptide repeat protein [Polynucleobacter asymbioticus]
MMKMRHVLNVFIGLFASAVLLTSNVAFAEPTLPEVYQAIESGQLAKADSMMQEVLKNHPNSGKAHYIASELYLKEGKLDAARNAFVQAENLAPGLPFAQPESVQKLQAQLRAGAAPVSTANTGASSIFTSPLFWILIAILIVGVMFFMKNRNRPDAVQVYNAPNANGPYPGAPGGYPPGYPGAPASGMGGGLMGSLATGAALGAGMVAGEALASRLMGGGQHSNPGNINNDFNQLGGQVDAANFGVNDASSWDDGGASSWDDGGGGGDFMSDV